MLATLIKQINILHETNLRICRNLNDTKSKFSALPWPLLRNMLCVAFFTDENYYYIFFFVCVRNNVWDIDEQVEKRKKMKRTKKKTTYISMRSDRVVVMFLSLLCCYLMVNVVETYFIFYLVIFAIAVIFIFYICLSLSLSLSLSSMWSYDIYFNFLESTRIVHTLSVKLLCYIYY